MYHVTQVRILLGSSENKGETCNTVIGSPECLGRNNDDIKGELHRLRRFENLGLGIVEFKSGRRGRWPLMGEPRLGTEGRSKSVQGSRV